MRASSAVLLSSKTPPVFWVGLHNKIQLGWIFEEIANTTGMDRSSVAKIVKNGEIAKIHNSIQDWLSKGKSVSETVDVRLDTGENSKGGGGSSIKC